MRYSSVIWRVSLETDGEDIVRVIPRDMEIVSTGLVMLEV